MNSCKSDVQKAAEQYYAIEYLPKIQSEEGANGNKIEGKIKVLEDERDTVFLADKLDFKITMDSFGLNMLKIQYDTERKIIDITGYAGVDYDINTISDLRNKIIEDSVELAKLITQRDEARKSKAVHCYTYKCVENLTYSNNGQNMDKTDTLILMIDANNQVLEIHKKRE